MSLYDKFHHAAQKALIAGALLTASSAVAHSPAQTEPIDKVCLSKAISYVTQKSDIAKAFKYSESYRQETPRHTLKKHYSIYHTEKTLNKGYKIETNITKQMIMDSKAQSKFKITNKHGTQRISGSHTLSRTINLIRPDGSKLNLDFLNDILKEMRFENIENTRFYKEKANGQIQEITPSIEKIKKNNTKALAKIMSASLDHGITRDDLTAVMEFANNRRLRSKDPSAVQITSFRALHSETMHEGENR